MSKIMVERLKCDRCGVVSDGPFHYHPEADRISMEAHLDVWYVGLKQIKWLDLCGACSEQVSRAIKGLIIG